MFHQQMTRIVLVAECDKFKMSVSKNMYRTVSFHFPEFPSRCRFFLLPRPTAKKPLRSKQRERGLGGESFGAKWRLLLVFA